MPMIQISSKIRDYQVEFSNSDSFMQEYRDRPNLVFAVDKNVWSLYRNGLLHGINKEDVILFSAVESKKNIAGVQTIYNELIKRNAKRNLTLVTIGGGILQDVTGFAASTLYRGIHWELIPTTLLAQADSCIGSKTSLNYRNSKNLIGSFYPPQRVVIYPRFTETLSDLDYHSGMGEVIKLHIMGGIELVEVFLAEHDALEKRKPIAVMDAVERSLRIKLSYMIDDEFDLGRRNLLNYGHCFGHAIESASEYHIPHGQAVILGMMLANLLSVKRGFLSNQTAESLFCSVLLKSLIIENVKAEYFDSSKIIGLMKKDKKRLAEALVVILLSDGYQLSKATDVTENEVEWCLKEILSMIHLNE